MQAETIFFQYFSNSTVNDLNLSPQFHGREITASISGNVQGK